MAVGPSGVKAGPSLLVPMGVGKPMGPHMAASCERESQGKREAMGGVP